MIISPTALKTSYHCDTCILTFLVVQFTIPKLRKQNRYHPIEKLIKKLWYIYTMRYCSFKMKNEIMLITNTNKQKSMDLGIIMLKERSHTQNAKYLMIYLTRAIRKVKEGNKKANF